MTSERVQARVFGEVAADYERLRPGYPPELVRDVLDYARLDGRPALEVGAGTGKATVAFAAHGTRIDAVEPDPAMLAILTERTAGYPAVTPVGGGFEDFTPTLGYGLLYSAQAWHWVDPERRWDLAAAALAPGGALALFWNSETLADPAAAATLVATHERITPHIVVFTGEPTLDPATDGPGAELRAQGNFRDYAARLYHWQRQLSVTDYLGMLNTQSPYRMLPDPVRDELFGTLAAQLPPDLALHMGTVLYLARRH